MDHGRRVGAADGANGDSGELRIASLVDIERGEIGRELFVSEGLYREEQERVFARAWLYVGHESQVPRAGDFFLSKMGEESVILTRDRESRIRVLLNSCRHRGMRVCRYDEGHTSTFYCPYHGWSYGLDGRLKTVTDEGNAYQAGTFDKADWGLVQAAQTATLRGTIWATWDRSAPSFEDYLGKAKSLFELAFTAWDGEGEVELLGSVQKWVIPSNWKIVAENFIGDLLHNVSHRSVDAVGIGPNSKPGRRDRGYDYAPASYEGGHGTLCAVFPPGDMPDMYTRSPATSAYFRDEWRKRQRLLGERARAVPSVGTTFPNMSFHGHQPRTILVAHPLDVSRTEMWRVYFVDANAPADVKDFLRRYYLSYSGPAGLTEQDDMENWNYATAAGRGVIARRHPYHYKAGLGMTRSDPLVPGLISSHKNSETNARGFYRRWREYMSGEPWRAAADPNP
jgi:phenylpropionate dioxygenase-like ring-hydroxylating dioxygenase large terminal subunit